jgi:hypothetical protein
MDRLFAAFLSLLFLFAVPTHAEVQFLDAFETGNLDNWTIAGRQLGIHTADVVLSDTGSLCGHLYQNGAFTEITLSQDFVFNHEDTFVFDLKIGVNSTTPPASNYYGVSGAAFNFLNDQDETLGSVWYLAATTDYPSTNWTSPSTQVNLILENNWHHFELDTADLLAQIDIDFSEVKKTQLLFETYSSTWPNPTIAAELWVDNVSSSARVVTSSNGSDGGEDDPTPDDSGEEGSVLDISGIWNVTAIVDERDCGEGVNTENYVITVTQSGSSVQAQTPFGTFNGSINGNEATWSGLGSEDGGVLDTHIAATIDSDSNSFTGTETWQWRGEGFQCSGTSQLSGSLGSSSGGGDSGGGGGGGCFISTIDLKRHSTSKITTGGE